MTEENTPAVPEPAEGGSFSRDPVTRELTRVSPKPESLPRRKWPSEDAVQAPAQPPAEE